MEEDLLLIERILDGDRNGFNILMRRYFPKIYAFLVKMGASHQDAEDCAQEVFIKAYRHLGKYNSRWAFYTWICKIALNTWRNFCGKKTFHVVPIEEHEMVQDARPHPEKHYENKENRKEIRKIMAALDDESRAIMILYYFNDLSIKDIGQIYHLSPEAIKMKLYRIRQRIAKQHATVLKEGDLYAM